MGLSIRLVACGMKTQFVLQVTKVKRKYVKSILLLMSIFLLQSSEKLTHELGSDSEHSEKKQVLVCLIAKIRS